MGKVVMYASVSVDGFIADENDQPGPLFDWLSSGDVPLDERGASPALSGAPLTDLSVLSSFSASLRASQWRPRT